MSKTPFDLSKGFIILPRDLFDHPTFRSSADLFLFIWLVVKASWEQRRIRFDGRSLELQRGDVAYPLSVISKETKTPKSTIGDRIKRFEKSGLIRTKGRTPWLILSICNYDLFQGEATEHRTRDRKQTGRSSDKQNKLENNFKESESGSQNENQLIIRLIDALSYDKQMELWLKYRSGAADHFGSDTWKLQTFSVLGPEGVLADAIDITRDPTVRSTNCNGTRISKSNGGS